MTPPTTNQKHRERREGLYRVLGPVVEPGHFDFATHVETGEAAEVEAFFDAALEASCEGIMVRVFSGPCEC